MNICGFVLTQIKDNCYSLLELTRYYSICLFYKLASLTIEYNWSAEAKKVSMLQWWFSDVN